MKKRLLSTDYNNIILEAFKLLESDYFNYYLNVVEEYYGTNNLIIKELLRTINNYIEWYNSKAYRTGLVYGCDDNGENKVLLNDNYIISLLEFGINRHIDKDFLNKHIEIIEFVNNNIIIKEKIETITKKLPEPLKSIIENEPTIKGFDYNELKQRIDLINKTKDMYLINVSDVTQNNVEAVYFREFNLWLYYNSDIVTVLKDGYIIPKNERYFMRLPQKNGEPNLTECITSDTYQGQPISENDFIEESLLTYIPKYLKVKTGIKNNKLKKAFEIYIEYLNKRQIQLSKPTKPPKKFDYKIKDTEKELLVETINKINLFSEDIDIDIFNQILDCTLTKPIKTNNNRLLAYFFDMLYAKKYINSPNWQSIIESNKLFITENNKTITANDLASAKSTYTRDGNPQGHEAIDNTLKTIKNIKS